MANVAKRTSDNDTTCFSHATNGINDTKGAKGETSNVSKNDIVSNFNYFKRGNILSGVRSRGRQVGGTEQINHPVDAKLGAEDADGGIHFVRHSKRATTRRGNARRH